MGIMVNSCTYHLLICEEMCVREKCFPIDIMYCRILKDQFTSCVIVNCPLSSKQLPFVLSKKEEPDENRY